MTKSDARTTKIRRTLELPASAIAALAKIKSETSAKNDTAAINDAVSFRARLLGHDFQEIQSALVVFEEVKRLTATGAGLVTRTSSGLRIEPADGLLRDAHEPAQNRPIGTLVPTFALG